MTRQIIKTSDDAIDFFCTQSKRWVSRNGFWWVVEDKDFKNKFKFKTNVSFIAFAQKEADLLNGDVI